MKKWTWMIPALALALPVSAGVYQAHNKWPGVHRHDSSDDECHEQHHLKPDGDHDCDDPVQRGVPEPGTLALLILGSGALWLRRRF